MYVELYAIKLCICKIIRTLIIYFIINLFIIFVTCTFFGDFRKYLLQPPLRKTLVFGARDPQP